jgi:glycosyltransferase involved in cell wall biosynthesis
VLKHLRECGIAFECRIVGGGPLAAELYGRTRELGLESQIRFPGALPYPEVAKLQNEWADIFLFSGVIAPDGDRDGLPNVIPEAMAAGLPVVTSPVAGTTEVITHGVTGLVLPLDDCQGWSNGIVRLARDAAFAENIRLQAHAWVVENFDANLNAAALAEAVRHAVFGRRSPEH